MSSGTPQFLEYAGMCVLAVGAVAGIEQLMKRVAYLPVKRADSTDEQDGDQP